jgi:ApaG protein
MIMVSSTQSKARGYSEVLTTGVRVNVESMYLRRQSQPESERYVFIYVVKITNESDKTIQLLDRHWVITDAYGGTEEVQGPGVIGETPRLAPQQSHSYHSFCPLSTSFGTMSGYYGMVDSLGERFKVEVGLFNLIVPEAVN